MEYWWVGTSPLCLDCLPLFHSLILVVLSRYSCFFSLLINPYQVQFKNSMYCNIMVASTTSSNAFCCWSPNEWFNIENTRSAVADDGCTRKTFWAADDQCERQPPLSGLLWFFHQSKTLTSEFTSAARDR